LDCTLDYIPKHLHANEKPVVKEFSIGEKLYYRCKPNDLKRPYDKISLYDISHNRNFNDASLFSEKDVLYNIIEDDEVQLYENLNIVTLKIIELQGRYTHIKEITSINDSSVKALIVLKHSPVPCMYPHSVFEISVNDEVVDKSNYKQLLNKKNQTYKNLRSDIRQELTSIIQTGIIDTSEEIEIIDEP